MNTGPNIAAGLHLFTSNRLETLADDLAERLKTPLASPLQPETIVVRNKGMERWLKQELARRHRICANVRFPFPEAFGQQIFRTLFPELPAQSGLERDSLSWRIMGALPDLLTDAAFTPLKHYLDGATDERKLVQLALKIANLFDQYLVFRPEMIADWDAGKGTDWQPILWRTVAGDFKSVHAAALWKRAGQLLHSADSIPATTFPERLSIFGVSALPPFYLDLFAGLAQRSQVNLFLLQPSQEYWGDITSAREGERILRRRNVPDADAFQLHLETGNRLLASMGYLGRDFLKLLLEAGDWIPHEDFTEPGESTLLRAIQSDILHLRDRGKDAETPPLEISSGDSSIEIHSCHSPLREMEVLHDQMLDWFERDSSLTPRDIVVMTPEIETYAPFIHAVFGSPESERCAIPFTVADRSARGQSQVIDTFLRLLDLPNTRLGATTVLGLLEAPAVRERFNLAENDLSLVRTWIEETNIRWGIDAEHRARLNLPELDGNTWRHGLNRLLLGYSMAGHNEHTFQSILPYDPIEGESAAVLGRFAAFAEKLFAAVASLSPERSLSDWATTGSQLLSDFFASSEDAAPELQTIRDALAALRRQQASSGYAASASLAVLIERLRPVLEEDIYNSGFLTGGVTFCGLKPMRSIPFKVVCLVGMNDNTFPRPTHQLSFDLMARKPRLGDRSTREDDRYLFLETILSARDRLYLSYVGQSIRDDSEAPPSVLISELIDCVSQGFHLPNESVTAPAAMRDRLVIKHRIQAFSTAYFTPGNRLFSYSHENCRASDSLRQVREAAKPFLSSPLNSPEPTSNEIRLEDLLQCFANPAGYFLQNRLNIVPPRTGEELSEREPFQLEGLERYALRQKLVEHQLLTGPGQNAGEIPSAVGTLPLGEVGAVNLQRNHDVVARFLERLQPFRPSAPLEPLTINLHLEGIHLTGAVSVRNPQGPLLYRCAKLKPKDQIRAWITHLAACAQHPAIASTLVGEDITYQFRPVSKASALLTELIDLFHQNLTSPLKFFPNAALAYAEAEGAASARSKPSRNTRGSLDKARAAWEGNAFQNREGEKDEPAFALCFRDAEPLDETFQNLALQIFAPMIEHRTEVEP
ncbi:MAG: exodeoxyribonuclease V subunit gamma [Verrucomicrobia bacterium]|nr:exodeoxyribonuclease V subunit gamma [Verrucomicrobiota bacterium]